MRTPRLLLRRWRPQDRTPFAAINADPVVMEHFPSQLTRPESDALADRIEAAFEERGFGLWAVEIVDGPPFIGFVGLAPVSFEAHFTPAVEVGWRLAKEHWARGYATEAGKATLSFAFDQLMLDEVVSFTSVGNLHSRRVMERLGLHHDPADDFNHPGMPADHRLVRHVLYRLGRSDRGTSRPLT